MKYTTIRNLVATGLVGVVAFGPLSAVAQDIPAPKDVAAAPADALVTASGLKSKVLKKGTGKEMPLAADTVTVHYSGWDKTGKMFDSSVKRGQPSSFPLNQVIKGWTEGLQLMVAGEKRRFWIPAELAYGKVPERPGAPAGDLCFDVELLKVIAMPDTPKNLNAIPENAVDSEGGVKSIVLKEGKGAQPTGDDVIKVNYTGWAPDGEIVDSSIPLGKSITLSLAQLKERPAFSKALQLLKVGEVRQIWIPVQHIVGDNPPPGTPKGSFCYQFELVEIVKEEAAK